MKCTALALLALTLHPASAAGSNTTAALAGLEDEEQFPGGPAGAVKVVTQLIREWSLSLDAQGKAELASYDKYACWCEDTLSRKAKDIASAKEQIDSLQKLIEKLAGEIASHDAEVTHLKKLIVGNKREQQETTDVRGNENAEYEEAKTDGEQCIGALEAAIMVLSGAGEGKTGGFLQTLEEAKFMSVLGGVRTVLQKASPSRKVSGEDLDLARKFFDTPPRMFSHLRREGASLLAVNNNPFGDYAPQSTRIQGVLKSLYDSFATDLEKGNVEEAEAQKSYEEFIATKKAELAVLEATLEREEANTASKKKDMAESKALRADVQAQLKADEEFFATTKEGCEQKAIEWSQRVRMRTEESRGIAKAIEILTDGEAVATFESSSAQLVQLSSRVASPRLVALQTLAERSGSKALVRIAAEAQTGGYFDKVMGEIGDMIALLRREEKADIEHRDRCQNSQKANSDSMDELKNDIDKAGEAIGRMRREGTRLGEDIDQLETDIVKTENDMDNALAMRNRERAAFEKSVKDDTAAVAILEKAQEALVAFYKRNKIPMLVQREHGQQQNYTIDRDEAPEVAWDASGAEYTGAKSENAGIVAIVSMIIEDIQKEISASRKDNADAQAAFEKERAAMEKSHLAQKKRKTAEEKRVRELDATIQEIRDHYLHKGNDLTVQKKLSGILAKDCAWVETHFKSRAENRKREMEGLVAAKNYLAGVEDGTELAP